MELEIKFSTAHFFVRDNKCRLSPPAPADSLMPGWLKPVLDAFPKDFLDEIGTGFLEANAMGYTVTAPFNFRISIEEDKGEPGKMLYVQKLPRDIPTSEYEHWAPFPDTHAKRQFRNAPWEEERVIKMRGFWYFETPPGYSCLFLPPPSRTGQALPLVALPGMVETDRYKNLISFPMIAVEPFPITVREGTPLVQVIPLKRNDWESEVGWFEEEEEPEEPEERGAHHG